MNTTLQQLTEHLRCAQLEHLRQKLKADSGGRLKVTYYPGKSASDVLITEVIAEGNDENLLFQLYDEDLKSHRLLASILHTDHHPSYEGSSQRTTRIYHFPLAGQQQIAPPQHLMLAYAIRPGLFSLTTADSHQEVNEQTARERIQEHTSDGGQIIWQTTPPEGDPDFWQNKLRLGLKP